MSPNLMIMMPGGQLHVHLRRSFGLSAFLLQNFRRGPLMKPVFVSKSNRETVREKAGRVS